MSGDPWSFGTTSNYIDYGQYEHCTCPTAWWGIHPPLLCGYCKMQQATRAPQPWAPMPVVVAPPALPQPLSDEDVERIAKRVAEILRGEG